MLALIYCIEIHLLNQIFEFQPSHNRRQLLLTLQVKETVIFKFLSLNCIYIYLYIFNCKELGRSCAARVSRSQLFLVAKATQAFTAIPNSVIESVSHTFCVPPHQPITTHHPIKSNHHKINTVQLYSLLLFDGWI